MARIAAPVGQGQINLPGDVRTVQYLLNRHIEDLPPLTILSVDGDCNSTTTNAIRAFQTRILRLPSPDAVVWPDSPTLFGLADLNSSGAETGFWPTPSQGLAGLSEEELNDAAARLDCETAAVKAVVATEIGIRGAFDDQNRPTILFERHRFHALTKGKFDKAHPDISNPVAGGYGSFSGQYPKLERAKKLDSSAALKSASWGAFQIMGENFATAGFASVEEFVEAMKGSISSQVNAFVSFVKNSRKINRALQLKDWAAFAHGYNGPGYKKNDYDTKMRNNYKIFLHQI